MPWHIFRADCQFLVKWKSLPKADWPLWRCGIWYMGRLFCSHFRASWRRLSKLQLPLHTIGYCWKPFRENNLIWFSFCKSLTRGNYNLKLRSACIMSNQNGILKALFRRRWRRFRFKSVTSTIVRSCQNQCKKIQAVHANLQVSGLWSVPIPEK